MLMSRSLVFFIFMVVEGDLYVENPSEVFYPPLSLFSTSA